MVKRMCKKCKRVCRTEELYNYAGGLYCWPCSMALAHTNAAKCGLCGEPTGPDGLCTECDKHIAEVLNERVSVRF